MHLFAEVAEGRNDQRPGIFLGSPKGLGRQTIIDYRRGCDRDFDGQSRTSDEAAERPMQGRYEQKMSKYGHIAH